ncbi:hypothetical protein L596_028366 [Steinernema carpocapsae]|uniref:Ubiquitin-like protease family profile domain-containing protein n=1 Tax=Steinernema carpocapsae TaxID=34508 RepID=A0A4U5LY88_STECR|nr:hypothetical protein L596_028366 [Steinernema carpocapsae]
MTVDPIVWNEQKYNLEKHGVPVSRGDVNDSPMILIPIFVDAHWIMCVFDISEGMIVYFDTMKNAMDKLLVKKLLKIANMLVDSYNVLENEKRPDLRVRQASSRVFQEQEDEDSCGPLACMIAKSVINAEPLHFTMDQILQWRNETYNMMCLVDPPPLPPRKKQRSPKDTEVVKKAKVSFETSIFLRSSEQYCRGEGNERKKQLPVVKEF